ncbi:energy transducer TonB [Sporohalobacter salinus]|uniref:energy transducer TonB n=1 Tax=Sporohalobacter salinus TaxID=1494606 RepID=UPI0019600E3E|nr:energy transducer TonB [Sporohalobacter salinus]MBM7624411.1 TonB family protein [Sporohalobacter salinus]
MRLLKKIKNRITPLKVAFIIAVGIHLAFFNLGASIAKLDNLAHSKGDFSQQVRFKMAAASTEASPSSSSVDKQEEKEIKKQKDQSETKTKKKRDLKEEKVEEVVREEETSKKEAEIDEEVEKEEPKEKKKEIKKEQEGIEKKEKAIKKKDKLEEKINKETEKRISKTEKKQKNKLEQKKNNEKEKLEKENKSVKNEKTSQNNKSIEANNSAKAPGQSSQETKQVDLTAGSKQGVKKPSLLDYNQPVYPEQMKKREIEGKVVLKVLIDHEGQVDKIKIKKSSGYKRLDLAAKKAVTKWRFNPARKNHQKIGSWILVPVRFRLEA